MAERAASVGRFRLYTRGLLIQTHTTVQRQQPDLLVVRGSWFRFEQVLHRRHVPGSAVAGGPRNPSGGPEPDRGQVKLGRGTYVASAVTYLSISTWFRGWSRSVPTLSGYNSITPTSLFFFFFDLTVFFELVFLWQQAVGSTSPPPPPPPPPLSCPIARQVAKEAQPTQREREREIASQRKKTPDHRPSRNLVLFVFVFVLVFPVLTSMLLARPTHALPCREEKTPSGSVPSRTSPRRAASLAPFRT